MKREYKTHELIDIIPKEDVERVLSQDMCDIDTSFLGFTEVYKNLAKIIPKHFTVVDLGCGYNPQCYYFTEHKQCIAVDFPGKEFFQAPNCEIYQMPICQFINENLDSLDLEETFAICSYVPTNDGEKIRTAFRNIFYYYPSSKSEHRMIGSAMKSKRFGQC